MIGGSLTCRICHAGPGIPCQPFAHFNAANGRPIDAEHDMTYAFDQLDSTE